MASSVASHNIFTTLLTVIFLIFTGLAGCGGGDSSTSGNDNQHLSNDSEVATENLAGADDVIDINTSDEVFEGNPKQGEEVLDEDPLPGVSNCNVSDYHENFTGAPVKLGIDQIESGQIYVHYSGLDEANIGVLDGAADTTSNVYVIKGNTVASITEVWIFGSGYGDPGSTIFELRNGESDSVTPASKTADDIDYIVQNCFELESSMVHIRFVAPHFHVDHFNQELFNSLFSIGYDLESTEIYIHYLDYITFTTLDWLPSIETWDQDLLDRLMPIGSELDDCNESLLLFESVSGQWSLSYGPGHTDGTLNLVNATRNEIILGAGPQDCELSEAAQYFPIHGNAVEEVGFFP